MTAAILPTLGLMLTTWYSPTLWALYVARLEALAARGDTAPLLLRLSDPAVAECVAGVWGS